MHVYPPMNHFTDVSLLSPVAYIDGGSGSMIFQVLLASILTVGYVIRTQWGHLTAIVSRTFQKKTTR